jgi:hypothetical protein
MSNLCGQMNKKCRSKDSNSLMNSEILSFPRFDLPFVLVVDSSSTGIGYILYQRNPDTLLGWGQNLSIRARNRRDPQS